MTEDEAKGKWCPMVRITTIIHNGESLMLSANRDMSFCVPVNSLELATDITKCIASACMMWRVDPRAETHGHCGLAGKEESRHV